MKFLLLSTLVAVALSQPLDSAEKDLAQWELFKIENEREYKNEEEAEDRKKIFMGNLQFMREHNAKYENGEVTFNVAINKFADMTANEFAKVMNGFRVPAGYNRSGDEFVIVENLELPSYVDWRKKGAVTPIKNQGQCGSCWAFSATGSLEGQTFLKTKKLVSLSEQNLVDCSQAEGNEGCNGGLMDDAFKYVKINRGIDTESSYPYVGEDETCHYQPGDKGATDYGYVDIQHGSENALQQAVAQKGPISVAIDASQTSFQLYKGGVYNEPACSSTELDHGVLAVGYDTARQGGDYWLVKNSWGTDWGMKGYIMMSRNKRNQCGIASMASFPSV